MKYGVVVYKNSKNIGDDIQSYAAAKLLPHVDYYIEREHLDIFRPKEFEPVNVIINGWFMYNKLGWPISACINPLYISMHFCKDDVLGIGEDFLEGLGGEDLRMHQPIGCRDKETQDFLENAGFETWFSGCVTLTLTKQYPEIQEEYICLVDVSPTVETFIKEKYPNIDIRIIHHVHETSTHTNLTWEERFANVEKLLTLYQNAKAVVTTRLHCAMPCLGLETPVLLLGEEEIEEKGRFEGLYNLVNHLSIEEFLQDKQGYDLMNPLQNPKTFYSVRKRIIDAVNVFIKENAICTKELRERFKTYDSRWEERALWKNQRISKLIHNTMLRGEEEHNKWETFQKGKDWLEDQYNVLREDIVKMQQMNAILEEEKIKISEQNNLLNQKCIELHGLNRKMEEENEQLGIDNVALKDENTYLNRTLTKLTVQNEKLQQENEQFYNNILELENSFSWKIGRICTAIPRKIASIFK